MRRKLSAGDPYCDLAFDTKEFPTIALGGKFYLRVEDTSGEAWNAKSNLSGSDDRIDFGIQGNVASTINWAVARAEGLTSIVSDVGDFLGVRVEPPTGLALSRVDVGSIRSASRSTCRRGSASRARR